MRHLDDGQIAELIDAAGGGPGGPASRDAEAHLRDCAACRERVEEARHIAARARAILGAAVPSSAVTAPPFAEVLHRAGRMRRGARRARAWRGLAWAATVVLAVGVGWYARGEVTIPAPAERTAPLAAPASVAAAGAVAEEDSLATTPAESSRVTEAERGAAPPEERRLADAASPVGAARTQDSGVPSGRTDAAQERSGAAPPAAEPPQARTPPAPERLAASAPRPDLRRIVVDEAPVPSAKAAAEPTERQAAVGNRITISRETAERVLGGRIALLEGLPVESYFMLAGETAVIQAVQRLPDGGRLELEQWRSEAVRTEADAAVRQAMESRARHQAAFAEESLEVNGLKVVARAAIPPDSLRALLHRLRQ